MPYWKPRLPIHQCSWTPAESRRHGGWGGAKIFGPPLPMALGADPARRAALMHGVSSRVASVTRNLAMRMSGTTGKWWQHLAGLNRPRLVATAHCSRPFSHFPLSGFSCCPTCLVCLLPLVQDWCLRRHKDRRVSAGWRFGECVWSAIANGAATNTRQNHELHLFAAF